MEEGKAVQFRELASLKDFSKPNQNQLREEKDTDGWQYGIKQLKEQQPTFYNVGQISSRLKNKINWNRGKEGERQGSF